MSVLSPKADIGQLRRRLRCQTLSFFHEDHEPWFVLRNRSGAACNMGSMINLAVGRLEIEWGKNLGFMDHTALFQSTDVTAVPYYFTRSEQPSADGKPRWEVITELKDGLAKPLPHVIDRINLLGHTAKAARILENFFVGKSYRDWVSKRF